LAARHQHGKLDCNIPDGFPDPNTQNRDTREMHLKLDELILVNSNARNEFMELDRLSDDNLAEMEKALSADRKKRSAAGETNAAE
jgi:low affinity Fe/Cu permease